jgi:hypothetical protein
LRFGIVSFANGTKLAKFSPEIQMNLRLSIRTFHERDVIADVSCPHKASTMHGHHPKSSKREQCYLKEMLYWTNHRDVGRNRWRESPDAQKFDMIGQSFRKD